MTRKPQSPPPPLLYSGRSRRRRHAHSAAPIGRVRPLPPLSDSIPLPPRARIASRPACVVFDLIDPWWVGCVCGRVHEKGCGWSRRRPRRRPRARATRRRIRRSRNRGGGSSTATRGTSTSGTRRPRLRSTSAPSRPCLPPRRSRLATPGTMRSREAAHLPR